MSNGKKLVVLLLQDKNKIIMHIYIGLGLIYRIKNTYSLLQKHYRLKAMQTKTQHAMYQWYACNKVRASFNVPNYQCHNCSDFQVYDWLLVEIWLYMAIVDNQKTQQVCTDYNRIIF